VTELEALRAEVNRLRLGLLSVAGCANCAVCHELAYDLVGTPWRPLEDVMWTWEREPK
jgi:hypothetical protein